MAHRCTLGSSPATNRRPSHALGRQARPWRLHPIGFAPLFISSQALDARIIPQSSFASGLLKYSPRGEYFDSVSTNKADRRHRHAPILVHVPFQRRHPRRLSDLPVKVDAASWTVDMNLDLGGPTCLLHSGSRTTSNSTLRIMLSISCQDSWPGYSTMAHSSPHDHVSQQNLHAQESRAGGGKRPST